MTNCGRPYIVVQKFLFFISISFGTIPWAILMDRASQWLHMGLIHVTRLVKLNLLQDATLKGSSCRGFSDTHSCSSLAYVRSFCGTSDAQVAYSLPFCPLQSLHQIVHLNNLCQRNHMVFVHGHHAISINLPRCIGVHRRISTVHIRFSA